MTENDHSNPPSLEELGDRLKRGRTEAGLDPVPRSTAAASAGEGFRVAIEFVVSVAVGTGMGYGIGLLAGSKILGLVLGMMIGFAAGLRAVHRVLMAEAAAADAKDEAPHGRDENGPTRD